MEELEKLLVLIKKYGVGTLLIIYLLIQHNNEIKKNEALISSYNETVKDTIKMMIILDERTKEIQNLTTEVRELRYEQRVLNEHFNLPPKRYVNE